MGMRKVMVMAWFIGVMAPVIAQAGEPSRSCSNLARYDVVPLPFTPRLITPSGVVAGITELRRAVVWHRTSGVEALSIPEGFNFTEPVAVMPAGEVLLDAFDASGHKRGAFTYSNHHFVALAGKQTRAHGVGAPGMIVGEWVSEGGTTTDAVYWSNTVPHTVGLCCGGVLKAVNERGSMVGDAYDERGALCRIRLESRAGSAHYRSAACVQFGKWRSTVPDTSCCKSGPRDIYTATATSVI